MTDTPALDRLGAGYYNSRPKTDANPGGMASNGHVTSFPSALVDIAQGIDEGVAVLAETTAGLLVAANGTLDAKVAAAQDALDDTVAARDVTTGARDTALGYRNQASDFADEAEISAGIAAGFSATSATERSIGGGEKAFTVGVGKRFGDALFVTAKSASDPNGKWMHGSVVSYAGGVLTINVGRTNGAGSYSDWIIALSGPEGPAAGLPAGLISLWSGSIGTIPGGWALCDGTNGTPDLRSRFIVGADPREGGYEPGATGGATSSTPTITVNNHTLTTAEMPSHTHTYPTNGGGPGSSFGVNTSIAYFNPQPSDPTGGGGAHNHTATSGAVPTLPPYYALAYVMKL